MGSSFSILTEIVQLLEEYDSEKNKDASLEDFLLWANKKVLFSERKIAHSNEDESFVIEHGQRSNVKFSLLLHDLSKHFKLYSKKVLFDSDLVSMDGHNFLSSLYETESMRKIELIKSHYMETPSGIEVINRLLRKGFIEEFEDKDDKRSKRVRITEKGRRQYQATLPHILKVIRLMAGNITEEKKLKLISILEEINSFHKSFHEEAKGSELDQLIEKHLSANEKN